MQAKGKEATGLAPLTFYKWHWQRYRANRNVQRMGYVARGLYRELLDEQWVDGSIPDDVEELADICGCPVDVMEREWPALRRVFEVREDGRLFNQVLEDQRTVTDQGRVAMAEGGSKGGKKSNSYTRGQAAHPESHPKPTLRVPLDHPEGGSRVGEGYPDIEEKRRVEKSREETTYAHREKRAERVVVSNDPPPPSKKQARALALKPAAEECHAAYPRKVAKEDSLRAFTKHIAQVADTRRISDAEAAAWMLERVRAYAASPNVAGTPLDKIPYPASWANAGRYDDPADAWQVTAGPQLVHQARDRPYEPGFDNAQALQDDPRIAEQRANVERWRAEYRLARDEGRPVPEWALRDLEIADAELMAAKGVQVH